MLIVATWCVVLWSAESMVLDPALYLAPSPPMMPIEDTAPASLWMKPRIQRDADLAVVPIQQIKTTKPSTLQTTKMLQLTTTPNPTTAIQKSRTLSIPTTTDQDMMEKSETFWPGFRSTASGPYLSLQGIHVPLTFSLTGTYGRYGTGAGNIGVVGSSYASVDTEDSGLFKLYGKSALAGSSYGSYGGYGGTRIFGNNGGAAWSGWGNGKWGHYGKG